MNKKQTKQNLYYFKKGGELDGLLDEINAHEKYLILQNDHYTKENHDLRSEVNNLKHENDELERSVDRFDTSMRYSKGLLKNLVEMEKMRIQLHEMDTVQRETIFEHIAAFLKKARFELWQVKSVLVVTICIFYQLEGLTMGIVAAVTYSLLVAWWLKTLKGLRIIDEVKDAREKIEADIKKTMDGQDFLHDHIDSL